MEPVNSRLEYHNQWEDNVFDHNNPTVAPLPPFLEQPGARNSQGFRARRANAVFGQGNVASHPHQYSAQPPSSRPNLLIDHNQLRPAYRPPQSYNTAFNTSRNSTSGPDSELILNHQMAQTGQNARRSNQTAPQRPNNTNPGAWNDPANGNPPLSKRAAKRRRARERQAEARRQQQQGVQDVVSQPQQRQGLGRGAQQYQSANQQSLDMARVTSPPRRPVAAVQPAAPPRIAPVANLVPAQLERPLSVPFHISRHHTSETFRAIPSNVISPLLGRIPTQASAQGQQGVRISPQIGVPQLPPATRMSISSFTIPETDVPSDHPPQSTSSVVNLEEPEDGIPTAHIRASPGLAQVSPGSPSRTTRRRPAGPANSPCSICLDPPDDFPQLRPTTHCTHQSTVCAPCLEQHISHAVRTGGSTTVPCPEAGCGHVLEYADVVRGAKGNTDCLDRYETLLLRRMLQNEPNFVWCKSSTCGWGQIHESGAAAPIVKCQTCRARSCFTHDVPWHTGLTCAQYDAQRNRETQDNLASQAYIERNAKTCPNERCERKIEKADGCDHMTCRRPVGCGHEFCWICLADYSVILDEGNHRHNTNCLHYAAIELPVRIPAYIPPVIELPALIPGYIPPVIRNAPLIPPRPPVQRRDALPNPARLELPRPPVTQTNLDDWARNIMAARPTPPAQPRPQVQLHLPARPRPLARDVPPVHPVSPPWTPRSMVAAQPFLPTRPVVSWWGWLWGGNAAPAVA